MTKPLLITSILLLSSIQRATSDCSLDNTPYIPLLYIPETQLYFYQTEHHNAETVPQSEVIMAQMCCAQMGYYCLSSSSDENSRSRGGDACGASFEETLSQNQYHLNNNNNNNSSMMISSDIGCYHTDQSIIFIRNAWPVVILWYGALLIFLYATDSGRNARGYACVKLGRCLLRLFPRFVREKLRSWSFCWCSHSPMDDLAERILAREVEIRNRMRSQAVAAMHARQRLLEIQTAHQHRQRRSLGENLRTTPLRNPFGVRNNDANSNPNALGNSDNNTDDYRLILRTKRYRAERDTETDNDDNAARASLNPLEHSEISRNDDDSGDISLFGLNSEEMVCTICLGAIQDNDRVGDIPCEHIFHVDCLKQWLQRKNACPLCQSPDLAYPKRRTRSRRAPDSDIDQA